MAEQRPDITDGESNGTAHEAASLGTPQLLFPREWFFNKEVHEHAIHHGWRPFHVEGFRVIRGRGFPDLAMFRQHPETGEFEMLVAELKRDAASAFGEGQNEWLEAFRQMGITTKVWIGENPDDRLEMYDIIENGTAGHDSVTNLPPAGPNSPIPANFKVVIENTIESIQSPEMTAGESASLRRMDPAEPDGATFWRLMNQRGMPRKARIEKWGLIMHGIALMAHGSGIAHQPQSPVGRTLYLGGETQAGDRGFYSEDRLATLLAAKGPALHRLLARMLRILANQRNQRCAFDWREMAWFILNEGHNEEEANQSRRCVARAYYQAQPNSTR